MLRVNWGSTTWPSLDSVAVPSVAFCEVSVGDVHTVLYVDCSKLGVLQQQEINVIGELADRYLSRSPAKSVLVLLPPLLVGSDSAGSLRNVLRRWASKQS